jgi:hypothetical protein
MLLVRAKVWNPGIEHSNADHASRGSSSLLANKKPDPFAHRSGRTPAMTPHDRL